MAPLKRWGCSLRTGCSPGRVLGGLENGVLFEVICCATWPWPRQYALFDDVPSMGYCMCNDDGAIFGRVNVQPARQKS